MGTEGVSTVTSNNNDCINTHSMCILVMNRVYQHYMSTLSSLILGITWMYWHLTCILLYTYFKYIRYEILKCISSTTPMAAVYQLNTFQI